VPELPEVEAVCRRIRREALHAEIVAVKILRPSVTRPQLPRTVEKRVAGRTIDAVRRRGKNILIDLSGGEVLHIHLRMTGDLEVVPDARVRSASTRAVFEFSDGWALVFDDFRALGKIWIGEDRLGEIGLEPLDKGFTEEAFEKIAGKSRQPAKLFLMDQRHVAGIGNIYAAEALWQAKINPRKPMGQISKAKRAALHGAIIDVLKNASGETYRASGDGSRFDVYDREGEPCHRCGTIIRRMAQGGRSTYFCPRCQR
jgi:formamidopyrimidine-DNA glycosylase